MNWNHRFLSTISYASESGFSDGDLTYANVATAKARVYQKAKTITLAKGEQRTTSHVVATTTNIPRGARVWLPGGNTSQIGQSYTVFEAVTATTLDGGYQLYMLTLGK